MFTLNKLNSLLQTYATNHEQIQTYRFEDVGEQATKTYPCLEAVLQPCPINGTKECTVIRFYISDKVKSGATNKIEALSDTKLIALDLLSYFRQFDFGYFLNIEDNLTLNDYVDVETDGEIGWWFDVVFYTIFEWDLCGIPATLPESIDPRINYVIIFNIEDPEEVIATVDPGDRYGVLRFSGISGGSPSSVYTNSIVGGTP